MRHVEARTGAYADSVTLMQVSARVQEVPGVRAALVAMATELNIGLLAGLGMTAPAAAGPNDLLVAIEADDAEALAAALTVADGALTARPPGAGGSAASQVAGQVAQPPRTAGSAARRSGPGLCLISVPGRFAFAEAVDALESGCDVMIFSDNVPVEQEVALKDIAAERGLLVMGPDCGTAVLSGVGLGFSHTVPPGPIGLVAASGTGAQQVICLLDAAGAGTSAVLGTGGRDLSAAVGGRSARTALAALDEEPGCELIMLLSKPPAAEVAADLRAFAGTLATPVLFALIGQGQPDLTAVTEEALRAIGLPVPDWPRWDRPEPSAQASPVAEARAGRALRGLFAGGTLCDEAMVIAAEQLGPVYSNIPLRPEWRIDPRSAVRGDPRHVVIDYGDDELTAGRPHPMIDQRLRLDRLAADAADQATGVILLDVVLGHGAHPDPAAELGPAIEAARSGRDLPVVVALIGARTDPQGLAAQAEALAGAGAHVFASNAQAARFACSLITAAAGSAGRVRRAAGGPSRDGRPSPRRMAGREGGLRVTGLLRREPRVITAGIDLLADAIAAQGVEVTRVDWAPPMPGTEADLAVVLADRRRKAGNDLAVARMLGVRAHLVDVLPASRALGLGAGEFLHAGPPLTWERASGPMRGALVGAAVFEGLVTEADPDAGESAHGIVALDSCHHRGAVGPMAGVVSPSMWVFVIEDPADGRRAYCSLNEGLGKVLRYGAYSAEVIARLLWMSAVLGPLLQAAVRRHGPVDLSAICAQMVQMGDEAHNRNRAGTLMLLRELLPSMIESGFASSDVADAVRFVAGNDHFFLNLAMPACKLALDAARGVPGSTMVVAMARNGTDFGIQVSGTADRWFTAPALVPQGLFLAGYGPDDANPDIGDSAITETAGLGGFAMAAAPAIVRLVGGTAASALASTERMYEITLAEHPLFQVPALDFRGTPVGIDVSLVARTGILPQINTGMAGKRAGTGQVGAGLVTPPPEVFQAALAALAALAQHSPQP